MAEFALAAPFEGIVEMVGVPHDLPPHVTVLSPAPLTVAQASLDTVAEEIEPVVRDESADGVHRHEHATFDL